jgi:hypothetical protein
MAAPHGPQLGLGPDTGEPIAQHGARVVVTPLLILDVAPAAVEEAAQVPQRGPTEGSSSASPIPARGSGAPGMVALRALPGALERSYWNWRLRSDLAQVCGAPVLGVSGINSVANGGTSSRARGAWQLPQSLPCSQQNVALLLVGEAHPPCLLPTSWVALAPPPYSQPRTGGRGLPGI